MNDRVGTAVTCAFVVAMLGAPVAIMESQVVSRPHIVVEGQSESAIVWKDGCLGYDFNKICPTKDGMVYRTGVPAPKGRLPFWLDRPATPEEVDLYQRIVD